MVSSKTEDSPDSTVPVRPLAEHADRTEFHRSRKLVAAGRTGALGLCAHSLKRPSAATSADSNATLHRAVAKSASTAPGNLLSRFTSKRAFLYTSALNP